MSFQKTEFHVQIENQCLAGKNVLVNAGPGSGKTTSIVKLIVPALIKSFGKVAVGACMTYNAKNAYELKAKLPVGIDGSTCHSLLYNVYKRFKGKVKVEVEQPAGFNKFKKKYLPKQIGKTERIASALFEDCKYVSDLINVVRFMKYDAFGISGYPDANTSNVLELMEGRGINPGSGDEDKNEQFASEAVQLFLATLKEDSILDFEDMLFFPLYFNATLPELDFLVYDEGQDCKVIELEFISRLAKKGTKIVVVGDDHQAINYWSGSMTDAFDNLQSVLSVSVSPMPVSYRCSKAAASLANDIFPDSVIPWDGANEGSIANVSFSEWVQGVNDLTSKDGVLARVHKFLFPIAMQFLAQGKEFQYKGINDLVQRMQRMLFHAGKTNGNNLSIMRQNLTEYQSMLEDKHVKADGSHPKWVIVSAETTESLCLLLASIEGKGGSWDDVKTYLKKLADMETSVSGPTLSTLHSAKGMEWPNVFIVGPMQSALAKTDKELMAEKKLGFVGVTRSSDSVTFVEA